MTSDVFDRIYRDNAWNGVESRSGPGSGNAATQTLRLDIQALVAELGIRSVLDLGCGDGYWMPDLPGYVGVDPSAEAVRLARRNHDDRKYTTHMPLAHFDLVVMRDVIQHLPLDDGLTMLAGAGAAARGGWLLASTYVGGENIDVAAGEAYSPDLTKAPFSMAEPDRLIFDGHHYHEHGTDAVRDPRKHLGLWRIAP